MLPASPEASPPQAEPAAASSHLEITFDHGLKSGLFVVFVDDKKVLEEALSSKSKFLGRRHGSLHRILPVDPGQRQLRVQLLWEGKRRSASLSGEFKEDASRRLVAHLGPEKEFWLEWQ